MAPDSPERAAPLPESGPPRPFGSIVRVKAAIPHTYPEAPGLTTGRGCGCAGRRSDAVVTASHGRFSIEPRSGSDGHEVDSDRGGLPLDQPSGRTARTTEPSVSLGSPPLPLELQLSDDGTPPREGVNMTTTSSTTSYTAMGYSPVSTTVRTGLALSLLLAVVNTPFLFIPSSWWGHAAAPPRWLLAISGSGRSRLHRLCRHRVGFGQPGGDPDRRRRPDHQRRARRAGVLHPRCLSRHQGLHRSTRAGYRALCRAHAAT